ncbi:alpha-amylase family glycosyl hydrolase [Desulfuromonas sp. KJ2020]|uniref:alpha-amylase family glycosyl hydrolase n=1 Tax=Desulfuromonas sp. KJ2020 TaxID=2919173 RepID=UPI0020A77FC0|nr:alpha-amylase family glycosyl hydrolase [Desulfuromonas sp. KJ2020]MCP3176592.1 alpha-amylase family glycosyl hydrolase [Desulfuromonas sp. KJ2020]
MTPHRKHPEYFPLSLQISGKARQQLALPENFEEVRPTALFPLRTLADRLQRQDSGFKGSAGQLYLLALLNRAFRALSQAYLRERQVRVEPAGVEAAHGAMALPELRKTLHDFGRFYPPAKTAGIEIFSPLQGEQRRQALLEMYILSIQMGNRAAACARPLFDDADLRQSSDYLEVLERLDRWLARESAPGPLGGSLRTLLQAPLAAAPDSLEGQLAVIRQTWGSLLPEDLLADILIAFDVIAEEKASRGGGPGDVPVPTFARGPEEYEAFSSDADWMANVVLMAKSTYVWLDQLSRRYSRAITRLDAIPDEELDRLARWGFTSLWLIGLWERSPASRKIKQIRGNPEASASAYSLYDYQIAADLGGDAALADLEERCRRRGIRLASDVVPNHTGLYSRWIKEHPDWFVQLDHPPYPAYRFSGPDLSDDGDLCLQIEDGYYDHSDAAVVFRYEDRRSGRVRFIYHGNDGTHMPWNDTAQLNYLLPQVREAMIGTILSIARRFRVIRFDAAMTLAKKHFQRLWFPQPGGGAGVPSRAEHAMERAAFEQAFPQEFWREVVDRVAAEVPDTLLIAEAFWLMEGYFVRTLGMHRVYNSAFMNMLKREENGKYRSVIKNVLEFNPEILKRFVNFMNNPDEATAVEQFGKDDKYFGVAVLLATLPGLPMFGHGQIEGLREKYGMEYRRAYWDESPDEGFIRHHEHQIFPLLKKRYLFSESAQFRLFDFTSGGQVNEDVLAYSNQAGSERALVVYHNRFAETGGWLQHSAARLVPGDGGEMVSERLTLAEVLGAGEGDRSFLRFRDHHSGLEYLQKSDELRQNGLYLQLPAYDYRVFLDFTLFQDDDGSWQQLHGQLAGQPAKDLDLERDRLRFASLHHLLLRALAPDLTEDLLQAKPTTAAAQVSQRLAETAAAFFSEFATCARRPSPDRTFGSRLQTETLRLASRLARSGRKKIHQTTFKALREKLLPTKSQDWRKRIVLPFLLLHRLSELTGSTGSPAETAALLLRFRLDDALRRHLDTEDKGPDLALLHLLVKHQDFWVKESARDVSRLLEDEAVARFLALHWHEGVQWFRQERFEDLLTGLLFTAVLTWEGEEAAFPDFMAACFQQTEAWRRGAATAGYRLDKFLRIG